MMTNYSKGKIYKIFTDVDTEFYIGSTIKSLCKRKAEHKNKAEKAPDRKIYKHLIPIGWDNVKIELIENYPCASKIELLERERYYIETMQPSLNTSNSILTTEEKKEKRKNDIKKLSEYIKNNPGVKKKCDKKRYDKNRELILEQHKAYYEANKQLKQQQQRDYRAKNKDKLNEVSRERIKCPDCDKEMCKGALSRHISKSCKYHQV